MTDEANPKRAATDDAAQAPIPASLRREQMLAHVKEREFVRVGELSDCFEDATDGVIRIGDEVVNFLPPRERDVAMVFQNYALYPQMTVFDNMAFGLRLRRVPKEQRRTRVGSIARMLGLDELLERKPANLSGGQRQRVAMGRAIAREPKLFLMDEPLSNLDAKLRVHMRAEIAQLQREVGVTTLYVTHDQVEAMTMGERIAVMRKGRLQQFGPPQELYDQPVNLFVASFLGNPAMNLVLAGLVRREGGLAARIGERDVPLPDELLRSRPTLRAYEGRTVAVGVRPEHVHLSDGGGPPHLRGAVVVSEALGSEQLAHLQVEADPVVSEDVAEGSTVAEDEVDTLLADEVRRERTATLVGRFDPDAQLAPGDNVDLWVKTERLHVFDPETGAAIR